VNGCIILKNHDFKEVTHTMELTASRLPIARYLARTLSGMRRNMHSGYRVEKAEGMIFK
jgi:hypothetical protein